MSDSRRKVLRWAATDVKVAADSGGFVAYGDYLALEKELAAAKAFSSKLEGENLELFGIMYNLTAALGAKDGDNMVDLIYNHIATIEKDKKNV